MSELYDRRSAKKAVVHHLGDGQPAARTVSELQRRSNPYNYQFSEYDFGILEDGTIVTLRPLSYIGAHSIASVPKYMYSSNWWNQNSIGIVIAIDATKFQPSVTMVNGLIQCLVQLCNSQGMTTYDIYPHFQITATACPGASYGKLSKNTGYLDYDYVEMIVARGGNNITTIIEPLAPQTQFQPQPSFQQAPLPFAAPVEQTKPQLESTAKQTTQLVPEQPDITPELDPQVVSNQVHVSTQIPTTVTTATKQKVWYDSKTIWVNILLLGAAITQQSTGHNILTPDIQVSIITVINLLLRIVTKDKISWS